MESISIIIFILGLILCGYGYYKLNHLKEVDKATEEKNKQISNEYNELSVKKYELTEHLKYLATQEQDKKNAIREYTNLTNNMNERAAAAFEQYVDALEDSYKQKEKEFENAIELLDNSYDMAQQQYIIETEEQKSKLENLKATRAAAMQAQLKEKEIKEQKTFYSLKISELDLNDIKVLNKVKNQLNQPRILSMLIWKTYYQKPMTELCNRVLGSETKTGIYKITNQLDDMCYIGQSVDIDKRWKDHAKCGLGIDTPIGNKLYKAMLEDGLYNFTFEVLEECSRELLNEKERFYIELYQADQFGYNGNKGVEK